MDPSGNPEAAFMGRITASTTHEFRNVLAIVKESAGLIDDLVARCDGVGSEEAERLKRATARIDAQVNRGAELLSHLNRFSHCLDRTSNGFDLDQEIEQVVFLSQRLARQGRHRLEVDPGSDNAPVTLDSLHFQMALFTGVEICLEQVPEGGRILVRSLRNGDGTEVRFTGEAADGTPLPSPGDASGWGVMTGLLAGLGLTVDASESGYSFTITIPGSGGA